MSKEAIESHILRRYDITKQLGHGAYGIVWKAEDRRTHKVVALKKIFDAFQNASDAQRTFREILFLLRVKHSNIIKLLNVHRAVNDRDIYLVFEYIPADLHTIIRAGVLIDIHREYVIFQLLAALKYLHSAQILHRDLKPSNILVNTDCSIKLADFGLARSILTLAKERKPVLTDYIATRWYRPPEVLLGSTRYMKGVDMWAVGCILGELILTKPIFPGRSTAHQLELILEITGAPSQEDIASTQSQFAETMLRGIRCPEKKPLSKLIPQASPEAIDLLEKLLRFNPTQRLSAEEALEHPYVAKFLTGKPALPVATAPITISLPDDTRYTVAEYRDRLYHEMAEERRRSRVATGAAPANFASNSNIPTNASSPTGSPVAPQRSRGSGSTATDSHPKGLASSNNSSPSPPARRVITSSGTASRTTTGSGSKIVSRPAMNSAGARVPARDTTNSSLRPVSGGLGGKTKPS